MDSSTVDEANMVLPDCEVDEEYSFEVINQNCTSDPISELIESAENQSKGKLTSICALKNSKIFSESQNSLVSDNCITQSVPDNSISIHILNEAKKHCKLDNNEDTIDSEVTITLYEDIKNAAQELIDHIENQAVEIINSDFNKIPKLVSSHQLLEKQRNSSTSEGKLLPSNSSTYDKQTCEDVYEGELRFIDLPNITSVSDEANRQKFIDSLPELQNVINESKIYDDCKRDFYQSLKKYLIDTDLKKPPVPLQTYKWEDLKRAKERGGYPWTHLYKRPLKSDEVPEILLLLRKSQEINFITKTDDDSRIVNHREEFFLSQQTPTSTNIAKEVTQAGTDFNDERNHILRCDSISCISDTFIPKKSTHILKVRNFLNRHKRKLRNSEVQSLPEGAFRSSYLSIESNKKDSSLFEKNHERKSYSDVIMKKLKSLADRQKGKLKIRSFSQKETGKIVLEEETKIIKLKNSPKHNRSEIPHFIEKQDSDDILEIIDLRESPNYSKKTDKTFENSINIEPDEIIKVVSNASNVENKSIDKSLSPIEREHVYEEITGKKESPLDSHKILKLYPLDSVKKSLSRQDNYVLEDVENFKESTLDRMGSSEEDQLSNEKAHLVPISSIDSTSSDENRNKVTLQTVVEEGDKVSLEKQSEQLEIKSALKKETSPAPSDKKVKFLSSDGVNLDICLEEVDQNSIKVQDNDYEAIGEPKTVEKFHSNSAITEKTSPREDSGMYKNDKDMESNISDMLNTVELTASVENKLEETDGDKGLKKGFLASAQTHTKKMKISLKNQASKIKTRLQSDDKINPAECKEEKTAKSQQFPKFKIPEIKGPNVSKLTSFKRPQFTRIRKPIISKIKLPEKLSNVKLKRTISLKPEKHVEHPSEDKLEENLQTSTRKKRGFDFKFGTYPKAFGKKKKIEPDLSFSTEETSAAQSYLTQPSFNSSSSPQGDRGPGPVRSLWADKFSDVSYNDSEGSRYRRYGSELDSFDKESSIERHVKNELEGRECESQSVGILSSVSNSKQFQDFNEENRAIHEISLMRSGEFKRRPIIHQDSDLRSEDSKDAVGWTEKEIEKNIMLRQPELDTQSTPSNQKFIIDELNDNIFFLRKRGISDENVVSNTFNEPHLKGNTENILNSLEQVSQDSSFSIKFEEFNIAPTKPKRLHRNSFPLDKSQESGLQVSDDERDIMDNEPPKKPIRKDQLMQNNCKNINKDDDLEHQIIDEVENINMMKFLSNEENEFDRTFPQVPARRKCRRSNLSLEKDSILSSLENRSLRSSILNESVDVISFSSMRENYPRYESTERRTIHATLIDNVKFSSSETNNYDIESYNENDLVFDRINGPIVCDITETDGYAIVRKDQLLKPTPPTRRKKFFRGPIDNFESLSNRRNKQISPPPQRPPPPKLYRPNKSNQDLNNDVFDDYYEEPGGFERPESPRDLQSGEIISKMKYRPLPPPPRPPREKRNKHEHISSPENQDMETEYLNHFEDFKNVEYEESIEEVEAATQTDPLSEDFIVADLEITENMRLIEPRKTGRTLEDYLRYDSDQDLNQEVEDDQHTRLSRGLQKFREANQRSLSERSRASSQTPSAIVIEQNTFSLSSLNRTNEPLVESKLVVEPDEIKEITLSVNESINQNNFVNLADYERIKEEDRPVNAAETEILTPHQNIDYIRKNLYQHEHDVTQNIHHQTYIPDSSDNGLQKKSNEGVGTRKTSKSVILNDEENSFATHVFETQKTAQENFEQINTLPIENMEYPLVPPRRKSSTNMDIANSMILAERTNAQIFDTKTSGTQTSNGFSELGVDRLHVRALQAGQLMVEQLHGSQISAEQLECNSTNLIVSNIQLPPGFIEDIVLRVKNTEKTQSFTVETQTNTENATSDVTIPESQELLEENYDQSNNRRMDNTNVTSLNDNPDGVNFTELEIVRRRTNQTAELSTSTTSLSTLGLPTTAMTLADATEQFLSACSLSLVNILNQLSTYIRPQNNNDQRANQLPALALLFIFITIIIFFFFISGKRLHTHHWDFFNLPDHEARQ